MYFLIGAALSLLGLAATGELPGQEVTLAVLLLPVCAVSALALLVRSLL